MKLIKEIRSKEGILHFKRWRILKTPWFEIYIHGIFKEDQDLHLHSHPWNIWTMVLFGSYFEELFLEDSNSTITKLRRPLNMAYRRHDRFHKIKKLNSKSVYTLAIVGKRKQSEWGYKTEEGFVNHIDYRKNKNKTL